MGRSFASLFSRRPAKQGFVGPTDRPLNPNAAPEARWAPESPKSRPNRPLINLNAPTDPVPNAPRARSRWTPMSPRTKGQVLYGRRIQLGLRVLALVGALGSLFCSIIITGLSAAIVWIIRVGPAIAILHTLYGIYHLSRSPIGKPLGTQASYMVLASTFDLGLIPFYIFAAYIAYMEFTSGVYHWGTLLGNANEIPHQIANVTFLLSIINGALHAVSFGISMFLATVLRRITRLPPDLNPLEDNLTARPHKRTKSELAEKHHSHSTLDSGIGMDDPLMGTPRTIPFTMHARGDSYVDGPERLAPAPFPAYNENRQSQGPFAHPDQLPYGDLPPRLGEMPFEKKARVREQRKSIPRKPVQMPVQNTDDALRPTPPTHLDVPNQQLSPAHAPDRSESVSPMSDNWIAYPSRSPSPLENILKDNAPTENTPRRDASSIYSRSNTTASTSSAAKDWNTSSQRYGWDVGETITEDIRGEYESLAMHEYYGNDDDVHDYPQQNGLYDNAEQDLGDHSINIYLDHNEKNYDLDDLEDDQELSASHPLNPLGLNPPTPQPAHGEHHEERNSNTSDPTTPSRHALADIPNLSPNPRSESTPAGDSPTKKTSRYYGELESNPSVSIRRNTSNQGKPSRKQSKLTKTKSQKKKVNSYGALRQDDHHSDNENENDNYNDNDDLESEGFPSVDMGFDENDRKGRVVSNSGADIVSPRRNNPGVGTALSSYGSYIAGLGVGLGRRRDVSGKMAEEGRGGSIVNAGRPGTEPESKTPIRAAGWARFAGY